MTLRSRITLWHALVLAIAIGIVVAWSYTELEERAEIPQRHVAEEPDESPMEETLGIILFGAVPALLFGLMGGIIITRRALRPLTTLAATLERTHIGNLTESVGHTGNGDEIDRLTHVFNDLKQRLAESFEQAQEFTLHASHELKTPLTIIHSSLEQMLTMTGSNVALHDRCGALIEEVQRLSTIVNQLTFLAQTDAGRQSLTLGTVPLHELVADAAEDTTQLAASNNISVALNVCEPCTLQADSMRLRQLLVILVDNAVKHNQPKGSVSIALRRMEDRAELRITNTGPVLADKDRQRVFQRFFRGDKSHGTRTEGSGLGLSIAEFIVRAHGGSIVLESPHEGVNEVVVCLPLEKSALQGMDP